MVFLQLLLLHLTSLPSPPVPHSSDVAPLTSPLSPCCLRVLLSCWLLPRSRSRHPVGVAAWLPRVPQLCTSAWSCLALYISCSCVFVLRGGVTGCAGGTSNFPATFLLFFRPRMLNPFHPILCSPPPAQQGPHPL